MNVENNSEIPESLDIYFKTLESFIPKGKKWDDLSQEEREEVKNKYRFSPMTPGMYQTLTGRNNRD